MQNEDSKNDKEPNLTCEPGIGFSLRDKNIKTQEEKGLFEFVVVRNSGENTKENLDNMKLLTDLKNIISKQLPKMPKEYIVRLVFDKLHESMLIIKRNPYYIYKKEEKSNMNRINGKICSLLSQNGITVSESNARYVLNADVLWNESQFNGIYSSIPQIQITVRNKNTGLASYATKCEKLSAYNQETTEQIAIANLEEQLEERFITECFQ